MNKKFDQNTFFLIAGPCVIESEEHCLKMATEIKTICNKLDIPFIFKASFDKANRTSINSFRGVGIEEGIEILRKVKKILKVPIITDVHESWQCKLVASVADILQIPAFLCRQTDLLVSAANTRKCINIKKGQFCSVETMKYAYQKILDSGNELIMITERGNMFGYGDLVVDFRNLVKFNKMLPNATIVHDCTHSLQQPNQGDTTLGGREYIPYLARAATAVGVNGLFIEVHDNPENALSDASTQYPLNKLEELLVDLKKIHEMKKRYN
jgi:2-dehydro-3-deoxyphosphooctonate aldolase (KDO 8-P synthase)